MDGEILERIYKENLEERLISYISEEQHISYEEAMSEYYGSSLADKIERGAYGVQYLDHKVLYDIFSASKSK